MTKTGNEQEKEAAGNPASDSARPSAQSPISDMPYFSEALSLNPLLANPAAAMAAATAIGFGFANQMASAFFGVMQGAMETANRQRAAQEAEAAPARAEAPAAEPVNAPEVVAEKVEITETPKAKATPKPAAKKVVAKAEPAEKPAKAKAAPKAVVKAEPKAVIKAPAKTKAAAKPADGDLKRISGIGPKLEGLLNGMGVTTVAQIAVWTDTDIARFDKELGFEGRIVRDDWVGQAKALLK